MGRDANSRPRLGADRTHGTYAVQTFRALGGLWRCGQDVSLSTRCCWGVRATTRSAGADGFSTCAGSRVTPKCDNATVDECTTTAATISVKVVIANPGSEAIPSSGVIRRLASPSDR